MAQPLDIVGLAKALKAAPLTGAAIKALDPLSYVCQNPAIGLQMLRSVGYAVTVTSDANGNALYQIAT
jgi:hypothetical protein